MKPVAVCLFILWPAMLFEAGCSGKTYKGSMGLGIVLYKNILSLNLLYAGNYDPVQHK